MPPQKARDLINRALRENRTGENILYAGAIILLIVGPFSVGWGVLQGESISTIAGVVSTLCIWPAVKMAWRVRAINLYIRLLEVPLTLAKTPEEALRVLEESPLNSVLRRGGGR
jgi:hypothetical protein